MESFSEIQWKGNRTKAKAGDSFDFHPAMSITPKFSNSVDVTPKDKGGRKVKASALFEVDESGSSTFTISFDSQKQSKSVIPWSLQNAVTEWLKHAANDSVRDRLGSQQLQNSVEPAAPPVDFGSLDSEDSPPLDNLRSSSSGLKRASGAHNGHKRSKKVRRCAENSLRVRLYSGTVDADLDDDSAQTVRVNNSRYRQIDIRDKDRVTEHLRYFLERLNQLVVKEVLTNWIDRICPRKQTRFPYIQSSEQWRRQHSKTENDKPPVPPWWPLERCQHKEPHHSYKSDRIHLAMHIIRMRDPEIVHWKSCGYSNWTDMLEHTTSTIEFQRRDEDKQEEVKTREKILRDFYELARQEEKAENNESSGPIIFNAITFDVKGRRGRQAGVKNKNKTKITKRSQRSTKNEIRQAMDRSAATKDPYEDSLEMSSGLEIQGSKAVPFAAYRTMKANPEDVTIEHHSASFQEPIPSLADEMPNRINTSSLPSSVIPMRQEFAQTSIWRQNIDSLSPELQRLNPSSEYWKPPMDAAGYVPVLANQCLDSNTNPYPQVPDSLYHGVQFTNSSLLSGSKFQTDGGSSSTGDVARPYPVPMSATDSREGLQIPWLPFQPSEETSYLPPNSDMRQLLLTSDDTLPLTYPTAHVWKNTSHEAMLSRPDSFPADIATYNGLPMLDSEETWEATIDP